MAWLQKDAACHQLLAGFKIFKIGKMVRVKVNNLLRHRWHSYLELARKLLMEWHAFFIKKAVLLNFKL
jgi:hypothetical protein